jgi:hypothetical protein
MREAGGVNACADRYAKLKRRRNRRNWTQLGAIVACAGLLRAHGPLVVALAGVVAAVVEV